MAGKKDLETTREQATKKDMASWKPGSEATKAKDVGGEGDFGVPVGTGRTRDRDYVSENTRRSDPGAAQARSGEEEGTRTTGAGATASGDGSGSGGDLDTDILGVGTGGTGVSIAGPDDVDIGQAASDGSSNEFASGPPAQGRNQTGKGHVGGNKRVRGTTFDRSPGDVATAPDGQGADSAGSPGGREDDSFAAEVSSGEASGDDNPASPARDEDGSNRDDV